MKLRGLMMGFTISCAVVVLLLFTQAFSTETANPTPKISPEAVDAPQDRLALAEEKGEEEEKDWELGAEVDFNSQYVWRGIEYSKGATMNPQAWVTWKEWTAYVWSNMVLNDEPTQGDFNEFDYYLTYSWKHEKITLEPSVVYYMYLDQEDSPDTAEASAYLSYDLSPFEIFTRHTVDFVAYDGSYFIENGVTFSKELNEKLSVESTASLGVGNNRFNDAYVGVNESAFNYLELDASFTYYLTENVYVRPHLEFFVLLDHDVREALGEETIFNGGGAMGVTF